MKRIPSTLAPGVSHVITDSPSVPGLGETSTIITEGAGNVLALLRHRAAAGSQSNAELAPAEWSTLSFLEALEAQ